MIILFVLQMHIEDNITKEYRAEANKVPEPAPPKKLNTKPPGASARKSKPVINSEEMTTVVINRCLEFMRNQMGLLADQVAEKLLEKMNKGGVIYKPATTAADVDNDQDEVDSFQNGPQEKKEFVYKGDSDSDVSIGPVIDLTQPLRDFDNITTDDPENQPDVKVQNKATEDLCDLNNMKNEAEEKTPAPPKINLKKNASPGNAEAVSKFMAMAKANKAEIVDKDTDIMSGKRKRSIPKKFTSPYALEKPSRRNLRGTKPSGGTTTSRVLNYDNEIPVEAPDELTKEVIDAAAMFVEIASRSDKNKSKRVYMNALGNSVTSERMLPVLDHSWLGDDFIDSYEAHLALRVGHDRHLCPAWRSKYLVDRALAMDRPVPNIHNMDVEMVRSAPVSRVVEEYTIRDKTYVALNVRGNHWITMVMHMGKQEFQVLDSLYSLEMTIKTVEALRLAISLDIQEANRITPGKYPDVSKWPIIKYDMPKQGDTVSCGLFVIECLEHWDGDRMTGYFSQDTVNERRRRLVTELIMSPTNTLEEVKKKIRDIARNSKE